MPWWLTALENLAMGGLGGIATVYGLSKFLGDVWLERLKDALLRDQKRFQAGVDRHVYVTKTQFDTEFDAMKQIFKPLSGLMLSLNGLRPSFSVEPVAQTKEMRRTRLFERLKTAQDAYDEVVEAYTTLAPFYHEEVHLSVRNCLKAANTEIVMVQTSSEGDDFTFAWFQEGERNRKEFGEAYEKVAVLMRSRIASLSVIP